MKKVRISCVETMRGTRWLSFATYENDHLVRERISFSPTVSSVERVQRLVMKIPYAKIKLSLTGIGWNTIIDKE